MRLLCLLLLALPLANAAPTAATRMEQAARTLIASLEPAQKQLACQPFAAEAREDYRYTPRERGGVCWKQLGQAQRQNVIGLLKAALSDRGLEKVRGIMELEAVLAELEKRPEFRDPEKYYVTIFGVPGDAAGWGWKFEGHHVSLNYTLTAQGVVSLTPSFLGANPAEVRQGPKQGLRMLAGEEDLARALAILLRDGGHPEVLFSAKAPEEILTREESRVKPLAEVGVAAAAMNAEQRAALLKLIGEYLQRHRSDLADADLAAIEKAGVDKIRFGWAGSLERGQAWYYRIQGPTFLMEAANSQNQANHTHAVWRDFEGDFGRDVLGEHYKEHAH